MGLACKSTGTVRLIPGAAFLDRYVGLQGNIYIQLRVCKLPLLAIPPCWSAFQLLLICHVLITFRLINLPIRIAVTSSIYLSIGVAVRLGILFRIYLSGGITWKNQWGHQ